MDCGSGFYIRWLDLEWAMEHHQHSSVSYEVGVIKASSPVIPECNTAHFPFESYVVIVGGMEMQFEEFEKFVWGDTSSESITKGEWGGGGGLSSQVLTHQIPSSSIQRTQSQILD